MKNIKNIKNTNNAITSNKAITAWAVEIDGEIGATDIRPTRAWARADRSDFAEFYGSDAKVSVRKVMITPVAGR